MLYILTNSSTSEFSTAILHDLKNEVYPLHTGLQYLYTVLVGCAPSPVMTPEEVEDGSTFELRPPTYLSSRFYRYPPKIPPEKRVQLSLVSKLGRRNAAGS